jgi:hypothetical protein
MGTSSSDAFCDPLTGPRGWWKGLSISEVLLIGGTDEIFLDDIKALGAVLNELFVGEVTSIVIDGAAHGESIFSMMLGNERRSEQVDVLVNWICKLQKTEF